MEPSSFPAPRPGWNPSPGQGREATSILVPTEPVEPGPECARAGVPRLGHPLCGPAQEARHPWHGPLTLGSEQPLVPHFRGI